MSLPSIVYLLVWFTIHIHVESVNLTEYLNAQLMRKLMGYCPAKDWLVLKDINQAFCFEFNKKYREFPLIVQLFTFGKTINEMNDSAIQTYYNNNTNIIKQMSDTYEKVRFSDLWVSESVRFYRYFYSFNSHKKKLLLKIIGINGSLPNLGDAPNIKHISNDQQMLSYASKSLLCGVLTSYRGFWEIRYNIFKLIYQVCYSSLVKQQSLQTKNMKNVILFGPTFLSTKWNCGSLDDYMSLFRQNFQFPLLCDEIQSNFAAQFVIKLFQCKRFDIEGLIRNRNKIYSFNALVKIVIQSLVCVPQFRQSIIDGLSANNGMFILCANNLQTYVGWNETRSNEFMRMLLPLFPK